jgi:hypothetical protein
MAIRLKGLDWIPVRGRNVHDSVVRRLAADVRRTIRTEAQRGCGIDPSESWWIVSRVANGVFTGHMRDFSERENPLIVHNAEVWMTPNQNVGDLLGSLIVRSTTGERGDVIDVYKLRDQNADWFLYKEMTEGYCLIDLITPEECQRRIAAWTAKQTARQTSATTRVRGRKADRDVASISHPG